MKKLVLSIFAVAAMATASMAQTAPVENPNAADFKFDTEVHDFGSIKEGVQAEHTFKFTNVNRIQIWSIINWKYSKTLTISNLSV